ncbi:MAG: biotin transporter BioY [Anaerolineales bacterium]
MLYHAYPAMATDTRLRWLLILATGLLTGLGAQVSIPLQPVPITLQVLVVLLAGLALGPRDAFASQVAYLMLIAGGAPLAANGLGGFAAFTTPTLGYLLSFPLAAGLVGWLGMHPRFGVRFAASWLGILVIYLCGTAYLKAYLEISWAAAWAAGVAPFIVLDIAKAIIAAGLGEGARRWLGLNTL